MPGVKNSSGGGNSNKKKGFLSRYVGGSRKFVKNVARDAEDIVTGFPTGVVMTAHALDQALPKSPIPTVDDHHNRSSAELRRIGKLTLQQMQEDIRHPLRNPVSTLLTVGGLASLGTGAVGRGAAGVSALSRGENVAKAIATRPKPPVRTIKTIQRPSGIASKRYKVNGKWVEQAPKRTGRRELAMESNPNFFVREARKLLVDPIYEKSAAKAAKNLANPRLRPEAKVLKHGTAEYRKVVEGAKTPAGILNKARAAGYDAISRSGRTVPVNKKVLHPDQPRGGAYARFVERRTLDQRKRFKKQLEMAGQPGPEVPKASVLRNVAQAPMDMMRASMYLRPRYYAQNLGGTASMLLHRGASLGDVKAVRNIAKSDPELYQMMKAAMGESGTASINLSSSGTGMLARIVRKMAEGASYPEANMRPVALRNAARRYRIPDDQLKSVLSKPDSNQAQLLMQNANEAVGDYSRIGGSSHFGKGERAFVRSGIPIFYPMTKAFTRYAGRFPTQYPIQSALIAALGQQGKERQRIGLGGEPQPWFPYITPVDGDKTQNFQNMYNFSPGADLIRQAAQTLPGAQRHPTLNLLQQAGPLGEVINGAITGRQLATGFEYDEEDLDKYGSLGAALKDTLVGITPGMDLVNPRTSKAFGEPNLKERLALWGLGPAFFQRPTDYKDTVQSKKKKKKKKSRGNSRF